jgi:hypothetical protein
MTIRKLAAAALTAVSIATPLSAQEPVSTASSTTETTAPKPFVGVRFGFFTPQLASMDDAAFDEVYHSQDPSISVFGGVELGPAALVAKYRFFNASGSSIIENIEIDGDAEWSQSFLFLGARVLSAATGVARFYFDFGATRSAVEETISTNNPFLAELRSTKSVSAWGYCGAVGVTLRVRPFVSMSAEAEYSNIDADGSEGLTRSEVNLGGAHFSFGLSIQPFNIPL